MTVDDYGRVIFDPEEIISMLYEGREITGDMLVQDIPEIARYNELCRLNDKIEFLLPVAEPKTLEADAEHQIRQQTWFMPASYAEMDIWPELFSRCKNDNERTRLESERVEYERRSLVPLLRLMMYLVDEFRRRKVVWGVGRGSSVASFALYLIGIIKINPMRYGLEIDEFLKD